jgi:hypothetical protein
VIARGTRLLPVSGLACCPVQYIKFTSYYGNYEFNEIRASD